MEVQVTTDHNIKGGQAFNQYLGTTIEETLTRFESYITHVDVHLADEASGKETFNDKRCILQAHVKGRPSIVATNHADTVEEAFTGALTTLTASLASHIDQMIGH